MQSCGREGLHILSYLLRRGDVVSSLMGGRRVPVVTQSSGWEWRSRRIVLPASVPVPRRPGVYGTVGSAARLPSRRQRRWLQIAPTCLSGSISTAVCDEYQNNNNHMGKMTQDKLALRMFYIHIYFLWAAWIYARALHLPTPSLPRSSCICTPTAGLWSYHTSWAAVAGCRRDMGKQTERAACAKSLSQLWVVGQSEEELWLAWTHHVNHPAVRYRGCRNQKPSHLRIQNCRSCSFYLQQSSSFSAWNAATFDHFPTIVRPYNPF